MKIISLIVLLPIVLMTKIVAQDIAFTNTLQSKLSETVGKHANALQEITYPSFEGGDKALSVFIEKHCKYPAMARSLKAEGVVYVEFIVRKDGLIEQPKALNKLGFGLEKEAVRLVKLMPKWQPGHQGNHYVDVKVKIPITFSRL